MEQDGRTIIQGQLGYLTATNETTIPILGAKTIEKIEENAKILEFGSLLSDLVKKIDNLWVDKFKLIP